MQAGIEDTRYRQTWKTALGLGTNSKGLLTRAMDPTNWQPIHASKRCSKILQNLQNPERGQDNPVSV